MVNVKKLISFVFISLLSLTGQGYCEPGRDLSLSVSASRGGSSIGSIDENLLRLVIPPTRNGSKSENPRHAASGELASFKNYGSENHTSAKATAATGGLESAPFCHVSRMDPVVMRAEAVLELMRRLNDRSPGAGSPDALMLQVFNALHQEVYRKFIQALRESSQAFADLPDLSIYLLLTEVEKGKQSGKALPYELKVEDLKGADVSIQVRRDENGMILDRGRIGQGSYKEARKVVVYDNLKLVAELALKNGETVSRSAQAGFVQERRMLSEILGLEPAKKRGLVKTLRFGEKTILQEVYDQDAYKFFGVKRDLRPEIKNKSIAGRVDSATSWKLLTDASAGLQQLHQMGWVHADIKPENMLMRKGQFEAELVLTDFGLSYKPHEYLKRGERRPCGGTPGYVSPYRYRQCKTVSDSKGWSRESPEENIDLAQREDVFAFATTIYEAMEGQAAPWGPGCLYHLVEKAAKCMQEELRAYQRAVSKNEIYDPRSILISRGVELDDSKRLNSRQLYGGMSLLQSRPTVLAVGVKLEELQSLYPGRLIVKEKLESSLKQISLRKDTHVEPPVLLSAEPILGDSSNFLLKLSYYDQTGRFSSKTLKDVNPKDSAAVEREIQFLRQIGEVNWSPAS